MASGDPRRVAESGGIRAAVPVEGFLRPVPLAHEEGAPVRPGRRTRRRRTWRRNGCRSGSTRTRGHRCRAAGPSRSNENGVFEKENSRRSDRHSTRFRSRVPGCGLSCRIRTGSRPDRGGYPRIASARITRGSRRRRSGVSSWSPVRRSRRSPRSAVPRTCSRTTGDEVSASPDIRRSPVLGSFPAGGDRVRVANGVRMPFPALERPGRWGRGASTSRTATGSAAVRVVRQLVVTGRPGCRTVSRTSLPTNGIGGLPGRGAFTQVTAPASSILSRQWGWATSCGPT